jgi:hypothetical protein
VTATNIGIKRQGHHYYAYLWPRYLGAFPTKAEAAAARRAAVVAKYGIAERYARVVTSRGKLKLIPPAQRELLNRSQGESEMTERRRRGTNGNGNTPSLEQRITAALTDDSLTSEALGDLLDATEAGIAEAEENVENARDQALDPSRSPDISVARRAMDDAELAARRLRSLLPKLTQRHQQVLGQETYNVWLTTFNAVAAKHAAAVAKLTEVANQFPRLVEVLAHVREVDAEVRNVMQHKPHHLNAANADGKELPTVECAAREVSHIAPEFSLLNLKLSYSDPTQYDWPLTEVPFPLQVMEGLRFPPGLGPDWHQQLEGRDAERQTESARVAAYHRKQAEDREKREAEEARSARGK